MSTAAALLLAAAVVLQMVAALTAVRALPHSGPYRYLWIALLVALLLMIPRRAVPLLDGDEPTSVLSATLALAVSGLLAFSMAGLQRLLAAMRSSEQELTRLATTDALTGVASRRHVLLELERALERAARNRLPLALLMIDVDRFKAINDRHGHAAGDTVLAAVASRCKEALRVIDACGRVGGEEFVVVLPDTDASGAAVTAERLRKAVDEGLVATPASAIHVTISIGLAVHAPGADAPERDASEATRDAEALLRRADAALYRAKARGRNRVAAEAPGAGPA